MSTRTPIDRNRRHLLQAMLAFPAAGIAGFTGFSGLGRGTDARGLTAFEQSGALPLTPACDDGDDDPTPAQTEGPYFKPNSPERRTLVEPGLGGTPLTITGRVVTPACAPIAGVLLDFWQADHDGQYDNAGFGLRGHQYTDRDGSFSLTTIVPGLYTGRTRHVHVKAQAPNHPVLTTQLYFPGEPRNTRDSPVHEGAAARSGRGGRGKDARFTFVLRSREEPDSGRYTV